MRSSRQARRDAKALFRSCRVNGILDDNRARQVVQQLLALKPRGYLAILTNLQRLIKLDLEQRTARIESAALLPSELQTRIQQNLTRQYGPGLMFSLHQTPDLVGRIL